MGQRMRPQKMLGFKQSDQSCQSGLGSHISSPRCVLPKPPPPILLPLAVDSRKPLPQGDLPQKTQKNREPDHLEPSIIRMGSQRMNRTTFRAPIALDPQRPLKFVKIPLDVTMAPQPGTPAPRTPGRSRPWVLLTQLFNELDIQIAVQYQVRSLGGITENTTPATESTLGYPFSFPSTYSENKIILYNKR
jgi:hypothetical protein